MDKNLMTLGEVAKVLGVKPHRITYALSNGLVEEPALRIANRRVFQADDLDRLAQLFGVELHTPPYPLL